MEHVGTRFRTRRNRDQPVHGTSRRPVRSRNVPSAQLVLKQIAEALIACKGLGMAHQDIKPANILIKNRNHVKLGDFGQVRETGPATSVTNERRGTEGFIAPEMGVADRIDPYQADIYSLGATIWMLVMLRPPDTGPGDSDLDLQLQVSEKHWPPVSGRGLPGLVDLVNSMLRSTQPELRPSAEQVKAFFDQPESSGSADDGSGIHHDGRLTASSGPRLVEVRVDLPVDPLDYPVVRVDPSDNGYPI